MADVRPFVIPPSMTAAATLVGVPMQVGDAHVTATVRCLCQDTNGPQTIRGLDVPAVCQQCGRVYAIKRVIYDRQTTPHAHIEVACVGFARGPESPIA